MAHVKILSIQSSVAFGHVGNSAATFPLQRLGHDVWPVITVHFSNHTGYGDWRGPMLSSTDVSNVISGIGARGVLPECDAVLSGYMGDAKIGTVILGAVKMVKRANPEAIYCCDPVMGDVGRGMFVAEGIPEYLRDQVVPQADLITPNHFELDYLAGRQTTTLDEVLAAVDLVRLTGPSIVLVTSVQVSDLPRDQVGVLAVDNSGAWLVTTPLLPITPNGCGDLTAALFMAHLMTTASPALALERTTATVFAVLEKTVEAGTREIQLIASQDAIADPPERFKAEQVR